jgi:hypothetical protein
MEAKNLSAAGWSRRAIVGAAAALVLAMSLFPALADAYEYGGQNLPGHTWTTGQGIYVPNESTIFGNATTSSNVCVGPVTHDAGGFHFPYGWSCAPTQVFYTFPRITAAVGIYNPNSGTFLSYGARGE